MIDRLQQIREKSITCNIKIEEGYCSQCDTIDYLLDEIDKRDKLNGKLESALEQALIREQDLRIERDQLRQALNEARLQS